MDVKELYAGVAKEKRRAALAHALAQEVTTVPGSRMMNIIGDALRWCVPARTSRHTHSSCVTPQREGKNRVVHGARRRRHLGTLPQSAGFDLLHGREHRERDEVELYPTQLAAAIEFGKKSHPECAAFTPDGRSLVTGSVDGFVEVWHALALCR